MSDIYKNSAPAIRSQVDIFSLPPTDTTTDFSMYAEYRSNLNTDDSNSNLEFKIIGNSSQYLDLQDSFLYLKVKVVNEDGSDLKTGQEISTTNLFLHAMFSQCDVLIKNKLFSTSNNLYPYKSYIETLLSSGDDYCHSQGRCSLFYPDSDNFSVSDTNEGYKSRKAIIAKSKSFELIDRLRFDLASQDRYILNNTDVTINLTRSPDSFSLCGTSIVAVSVGGNATPLKAKVKILDASFFIRKQVLYPSIILAHQKLLENNQMAKYPFKRSDVKYFTIPSGNQSFVEENVFMTSIPSRIVLGFVTSSAFNGSYAESPFRFQHFDVSYLSVSVNNLTSPIKPYNLDFSNNQYLLPYYMLFATLGISGKNTGLKITPHSYARGNTLFAFDINQANYNTDALSLDKTGNIRLDIRFKTALTEAIHCIVFSEHQSVLQIDKFREIAVQ
jgi:hypothetical protein